MHVMENLSDPARLGGGIAAAFVATLYGVGLANLLLLPVANRLKSIVAREVEKRELMADVFFNIASGDNARVIDEQMSAYG
jgi:chemotaxis protein MotA